jgi:methyl-accepting chemotaxis protein
MRLRSLSLKLALMAIVSLAVVFAIGMFVLVQQVGATIKAQTDQLQAQTTGAVANEVSAELDKSSQAAKGMVVAITGLRTNGMTDRFAFDAVIRTTLEQNPQLLGAWAGFEPNALDGKDTYFVDSAGSDSSGRYVPYFNRGSGTIKLEPLVDYDKPGAGDYYQLPKSLGRAVAIEPYVYAVGGKDVLMTSFGMPIIVDGKYLGTGGIDLALGDLAARIAERHPFGTGEVEVVTSAGVVVASQDAEAIGKVLPADDPTAILAAEALKGTTTTRDATDPDGTVLRSIAVPFKVGATEDQWVVVTSVPVATLEAALNQAQMMIIGLAVICVLIAGAILFALIRQMVGRPLGNLGKTVTVMSEGKYDIDVTGQNRADEVGTLARAVEVFRQNGLKVAEMTEAEAARIVSDQQARARMMAELQKSFGEVVDAAIAGDFSRRVRSEFPDPELNALAGSVNGLVETVDRGLGETGEVLAALADTDLTKRMEGDYSGAFARLKHDTNAVADKLSDIVGQLKETSRGLKTATGEILSGANDLSERTTKQAATIEETSAAMEQLASTVLKNADRAKEASGVAGRVTVTAEEGGKVMGEANMAMERITASSAKISNIIGLIDDIAFQTNLLALNASVEAARAGDAGKGFAVVAVEVRRLAQSAASASAEVKVLIEQSGTEVSTGSKLVADAAARLEVMLEAARSSSSLMDGIARDSREQASAIEEVTTAVRQLDEMTQHNAALVEETNAAIEQTEAQASELDRVVDIFTVSGSGSMKPARSAAPAKPAPAASGIKGLQQKVKQAAASYLTRGNAAVDKDWAEF